MRGKEISRLVTPDPGTALDAGTFPFGSGRPAEMKAGMTPPVSTTLIDVMLPLAPPPLLVLPKTTKAVLKSFRFSAVGRALVLKAAVPVVSTSSNPAPVELLQQGGDTKELFTGASSTESCSPDSAEKFWLPSLSSTTALRVNPL